MMFKFITISRRVLDNLRKDQFETVDFEVMKNILEKVEIFKQAVDGFSQVSKISSKK